MLYQRPAGLYTVVTPALSYWYISNRLSRSNRSVIDDILESAIRPNCFRPDLPQSSVEWSPHEPSPLFDCSSLPALDSDIRLVAETCAIRTITQPSNRSSTQWLAYGQFDAHDRYVGSTSHETETAFRLFLPAERYGWDRETAFVE